MAAPASLAVSKLFYPETQPSKTTIKDIKIEKGEESNVLDAAAKVVHFKSCLIIVRERVQLFREKGILPSYVKIHCTD